MRAGACLEAKHRALRDLLTALSLVLAICQPAMAREPLRMAELPRDFQAWAAWRADDASLSVTAMGRPLAQLFHAGDFCLGAMVDAGMAQGVFGGLPLNAMAYCPPGLAAYGAAGQPAPAIRLVSNDRPITTPPVVSVITQDMCTPAIRNR
ncbi:MAG: hypothetical protein ACR2IG_08660 [Roseomonas sp.]